MFANASRNVDGAAQECSASVDGDIAGQGAQIAVWAQVGVLLIISVLGSFHTSADAQLISSPKSCCILSAVMRMAKHMQAWNCGAGETKSD